MHKQRINGLKLPPTRAVYSHGAAKVFTPSGGDKFEDELPSRGTHKVKKRTGTQFVPRPCRHHHCLPEKASIHECSLTSPSFIRWASHESQFYKQYFYHYMAFPWSFTADPHFMLRPCLYAHRCDVVVQRVAARTLAKMPIINNCWALYFVLFRL